LKSGLGLNWELSKPGLAGLKSGRFCSSFSKLGLPFSIKSGRAELESGFGLNWERLMKLGRLFGGT